MEPYTSRMREFPTKLRYTKSRAGPYMGLQTVLPSEISNSIQIYEVICMSHLWDHIRLCMQELPTELIYTKSYTVPYRGPDMDPYAGISI